MVKGIVIRKTEKNRLKGKFNVLGTIEKPSDPTKVFEMKIEESGEITNWKPKDQKQQNQIHKEPIKALIF